MRGFICIGILLLAQLARGADAPAPPKPAIDWQDWSPAVFEKARTNRKLIILDLHAVWCHWCHVMDEKTYSDPKVIELIRSNFVAIGVDQDARPDLASRYGDYGWPATIIYDSNGNELAKRQGYIPPEAMASMLQAFIDDSTPGPSVIGEQKPVAYSTNTTLPDSLQKELQDSLLKAYDSKLGSWGTGGQKFLDWDNIEFCMRQAKAGDARYEKMAKQTLDAQLKLIDPAWGGVYQYSTDGDWNHPHFEKIMQFQAENLRIYAAAYALWKDPKYLKAATSIRRYVHDFLTSPEGAFYTSQDADVVPGEHAGEYFKLGDAERRKKGIPKVDTHIYARENGWMIYALTQLYAATGDQSCLDDAVRATRCMMNERSLPSGGWRHDEDNQAGPYLADSLYMGRALLGLYAVTGEREWVDRAQETLNFMQDRFQPAEKDAAGLMTTSVSGANISDPKPQFDENAASARFANLLSHYTDNPHYREFAECAMRYLATPEIARKRGAYTGALLLAGMEMNADPLHVVIAGSKKDGEAKKLFDAAAQYPLPYKQVEWQDKTEPPLHKELTYPDIPKPAAYICTGFACSSPILKAEDLAPRIDHLLNPAKKSSHP